MHYTWRVLRAGAFRLDGGGMFGVVPKTLWSKMVEADANNRIGMQSNCLLLEAGGRRVLVETGYGGKWTDKERGFYDLERRTIVDALDEIGVTPDAIDDIVLTHLHFDHAGGLTHLDDGGAAVSTFPRATIHVQQTEWDDARANKSTMSRTYLDSHLSPIADQVRCVDGATEVLPGIDVIPLPGHTWGQQGVCFRDADGVVCFPGDVVPTVHHAAPAFSMGYDVLPWDNMQTKQQLLDRAADERWRLALDHDPDHPVVTVDRDPDRPGRFRLHPASEPVVA